ncbi:putative bulb-type lectin domain-containing protein [Helianthus debilis subsp. tardiflorus]
MLLLFSGNNTVIWSYSSSVSVGNAPVVAKLLDSGNLVVCDDSSTDEDFVWQSFDYPTDTLLAGMKFGKDLVTGVDRYLTSWNSMDDPSPCLYVLRSIHIGLLCVQNHAEDRPTMSSVVLMLGDDGVLSQPKSPALFTEPELDLCAHTRQEPSVTNVTISLTGRYSKFSCQSP